MSKILTQMVQAYQAKHNQMPDQIVVAPIALVGLGLSHSVAPVWHGVPVKCRLFHESEVVEPGKGNALGVFAKGEGKQVELVSCDLGIKSPQE